MVDFLILVIEALGVESMAAAIIADAIVTYSAYAAVIAYSVYGSVEARRKAAAEGRKQRADYNSNLSDRAITTLQSSPPFRVVYGRAIVGGDILGVFTSDKSAFHDDGTAYTKSDGYKHVVVHIASHAVHSIKDTLISGIRVGTLSNSGWATNTALGTGKNYTVASATCFVGTTSISIVNGTGTILAGDEVSFTGDDNRYPVVTGVTGPGTIVIASPGLLVAAPVGAEVVLGNEFCKVRQDTRSLLMAPGQSVTVADTIVGISTTYGTARATSDYQDLPISSSATVDSSRLIITNPNNVEVIVSYSATPLLASVRISYHLGSSTQAVDTFLNSVVPNEWTANHRLQGLSYAVITFDLEEQRFQGGIPQLSFDVEGKEILDTRTGVVAYSTNPALIIRDFLTAQDYGFQCKATDIDLAVLNASANACDVSTNYQYINTFGATISKPEALFTCNGSFTSDTGRESVLNDLCESMAGFATYGSQWSIQAGAWTTPVMTLTDADLDGQIDIVQAGAGLDTLFNGTRGTYIPAGKASPIDFLPYQNASFLTADNGLELWNNVTYPYTDSKYRCEQLARIMTERNRYGQVITYPAKLKAWPLVVGDRVIVNSAEYGFVSKTYRVTDWQFTLNSAVGLVLQEETASVYDMVNATIEDLSPASTLPNPNLVETLTGLTAVSGTTTLKRFVDGTIVPQVKVSWDMPKGAYLSGGQGEVALSWRRASGSTWDTIYPAADDRSVFIGNVVDLTTIFIKAYFINSSSSAGNPMTITHFVLGKSQKPSDVTLLTYTAYPGRALVKFAVCPDLDYSSVCIQVGAWSDSAAMFFEGDVSEYSYSNAAGTYTLYFKFRDATGNLSTNVASITVVVPVALVANLAALTGAESILNSANSVGANLCPNSDFSAGFDGWAISSNPHGSTFGNAIAQTGTTSWSVNGGAGSNNTSWSIHQAGTDQQYDEIFSELVPVIPGLYYCASAYTGNHRCTGYVFIYWFNTSGGTVGNGQLQGNAEQASGGTTLAGYLRIGYAAQAPAGAAYGRVVIRKQGPSGANTDSWMFFCRAQFEQVGATATGPGPWSPSGVDTRHVNALLVPSINTAGTTATWGSGTISGQPSDAALLNAQQTWSQVSGAGRPADNASSDISLYQSAGTYHTISGNSVGANNGAAWSGNVASRQAQVGACYCAFSIPSSAYYIAGIDPSPTVGITNAAYTIISRGDGNISARELGSEYALGTYTAGDVVSIEYNGSAVRYLKNGAVLRAIAASTGQTLYFVVSVIGSLTPTLNSIRFGPLSSTAWTDLGNKPADAALLNSLQTWAQVSGAGRPADNATVGAQAGTNLKDSSGTILGDAAVKNSAITLNSSGGLSGAGGGAVTLGGLGTTGVVGGGNICVNGDFLLSSGGIPTNFANYNNGGISTTNSISSGGPLAGTNFWRITNNATVANTWGFYFASAVSAFGGWKANTNYVVSFYARMTGNPGSAAFTLGWNSGPAVQSILQNPTLQNGVWQRYVFLVNFGSNTIDPNGFFSISPQSLPSGNNLDFSCVQVEQGDIASGFAVAPLSNANPLTAANKSQLGYTGDLNATANQSDATTNAAIAAKLAAAGGQNLTGRITMAVADGIFAGTDVNNGVYLGNTGLLGKKAGATTFSIDTAGNATFGGALSAVTGTLGDLTIAAGGNIKQGQSAYNTGVGLWIGNVSGTPKFSMGNPAGNYLLWDGTKLVFDTFSASISGGGISVSVQSYLQAYGNRSVSVSGGVAPYTYLWLAQETGTPSGAYGTSGFVITSGVQSAAASISGYGNGDTHTGVLACIVTDSNGRTTVASISVQATHAYTPPGTAY